MPQKQSVVYFAHGKESGPWGLKIKQMAKVAEARGLRVVSPDYSDTMDPAVRVERLKGLLAEDEAQRVILVGSSMGGYVSAFASACDERIAGLFLLAPALYMQGYEGEPTTPAVPVTVVHGWQDDIVPPANAYRFAEKHGARLLMLDALHDLNAVVAEVCAEFEVFLQGLDEAG